MTQIENFKKEVDQGLSKEEKCISSKYFYDQKGDELFVEIMNSPEYYLSRAEMEIWKRQGKDILKSFDLDGKALEIFELGAGDGTKSIELLKVLNGHNYSFRPIDISQNALNLLKEKVESSLPKIRFEGIQGDYFEALESISGDKKKIILFLGSNIGNLDEEQTSIFLGRLSELMSEVDRLIIGFDLKKAKSIVLPAYNDSKGITRDFNLNLLERMNRELGANFNKALFEHAPEYDEESGLAQSFLLSKVDQEVFFKSLNKGFCFKKGEKIHTEISRKYSLAQIETMASRQNLSIVDCFFDTNKYFADIVFKKEKT